MTRIQEPMEEQTLVIPALQVVDETLFSHQAKLFRMRDGGWEERGLGDPKLHMHRKTGRACPKMRKESAMEFITNFYVLNVLEYYELKSNAGNDRTWVWMAFDRSCLDLGVDGLTSRFPTEGCCGAIQNCVRNGQAFSVPQTTGEIVEVISLFVLLPQIMEESMEVRFPVPQLMTKWWQLCRLFFKSACRIVCPISVSGGNC